MEFAVQFILDLGVKVKGWELMDAKEAFKYEIFNLKPQLSRVYNV